MPVEHSPKTKNVTITDLPPDGMAPPGDSDGYTKDEVTVMPEAHCQWLHYHQEMFDWQTVDLMDYHEDFVGPPARDLSSDDVGDLTVNIQQLLTGRRPQNQGPTAMDTDIKPDIPGVVPPVALQAFVRTLVSPSLNVVKRVWRDQAMSL
ncbi:hypothetical protein PCANC_00316 [Puccinia coronata f. sp. avenae]|uniref:Uncharacterized protein n=1 Tax=Puccinia coronata f. sp. avenae TaxID=200324 RepID=A0A2N5W905_9BASI|nr:hypothetical protein PCANC_05025 [Puccinia coronata f. sp. avenae]PLW58707.1 hypothetical protein PCANC_00316 [Puccinia coronata f. sp. avenae]